MNVENLKSREQTEVRREMEKYKKSWEFHGRTLTVENGEIAKQAGGSVVIRYADTQCYLQQQQTTKQRIQIFSH